MVIRSLSISRITVKFFLLCLGLETEKKWQVEDGNRFAVKVKLMIVNFYIRYFIFRGKKISSVILSIVRHIE